MSIHIGAKSDEVAPLVIMPGDPLRVKYIAEKYLKDAKLINKIRINLGYTGYYNNKQVTILASGMGMPSMGIYANELFREYGVKKIIRVGSCGSYYKEIKIRDIILVEKAYTLSNFAFQDRGVNINLISASTFLNNRVIEEAVRRNIDIKIGNINTSDVFYNEIEDDKIKQNYCLGVEMETFALFYIAKKYQRDAASILTVSDNLITKEKMSSDEREQTLDEAIVLALNSITI